MTPPPAFDSFRVLVIGGYGFFGRRLVELLARRPGLHVIVAGRSAAQAGALVASLAGNAKAVLEAVALDANSDQLPAQLAARTWTLVDTHGDGPYSPRWRRPRWCACWRAARRCRWAPGRA